MIQDDGVEHCRVWHTKLRAWVWVVITFDGQFVVFNREPFDPFSRAGQNEPIYRYSGPDRVVLLKCTVPDQEVYLEDLEGLRVHAPSKERVTWWTYTFVGSQRGIPPNPPAVPIELVRRSGAWVN